MDPTYSTGAESGRGMVMRISSKILVQTGMAAAIGIAVLVLKQETGGCGGMVPGLLGFAIAWLVIPAVYNDVLRRWLSHRSGGEVSLR
jgi:hypothetical protein